jgi:phage tail sheath gpL-like
MPIPFEEIPSNVLAPLFYAEVKGAQTPYNANLRLLLVGHRNEDDTPAEGSGEDNTPYLLSDFAAKTLFGPGSMLHAMYDFARKNAPFAEIWGVAAAPDEDGERAVGSLTVKRDPDRGEGAYFLIAGQPVEVIARAEDTAAGFAIKTRDAINRRTSLPVRARIDDVDNTKVNVTVKWRGFSGNDVDISINYYGRENYASKRLYTVTQPTGGTAVPGLTAALASIGD